MKLNEYLSQRISALEATYIKNCSDIDNLEQQLEDLTSANRCITNTLCELNSLIQNIAHGDIDEAVE